MRLQQNNWQITSHIPRLILSYTQGNLNATDQVLQKLQLTYPANTLLIETHIKQFLHDQSEYKLFELTHACLSGNTEQALLSVRYLLKAPKGCLLIVWALTQEIRHLNQLYFLTQYMDWPAACTQLKLWSSQFNLYQAALNQRSLKQLEQLLLHCYQLDTLIKSGQLHCFQRQLDA